MSMSTNMKGRRTRIPISRISIKGMDTKSERYPSFRLLWPKRR